MCHLPRSTQRSPSFSTRLRSHSARSFRATTEGREGDISASRLGGQDVVPLRSRRGAVDEHPYRQGSKVLRDRVWSTWSLGGTKPAAKQQQKCSGSKPAADQQQTGSKPAAATPAATTTAHQNSSRPAAHQQHNRSKIAANC